MIGLLVEKNCYFNILHMELDQSIEIIISVINKFFDDRLYDTYSRSMLFSEKYMSFEEYKSKCMMVGHTSQNYKSFEEIKNENESILLKFSQ